MCRWKLQTIGKRNLKKYMLTTSLDIVLDDDENIRLVDTISSRDDIEKLLIQKETVNRLYEMNRENQQVLDLLYKGHNMKQACKLLGWSRDKLTVTIRGICKRALTHLK